MWSFSTKFWFGTMETSFDHLANGKRFVLVLLRSHATIYCSDCAKVWFIYYGGIKWSFKRMNKGLVWISCVHLAHAQRIWFGTMLMWSFSACAKVCFVMWSFTVVLAQRFGLFSMEVSSDHLSAWTKVWISCVHLAHAQRIWLGTMEVSCDHLAHSQMFRLTLCMSHVII
jgi:hypothetical protein